MTKNKIVPIFFAAQFAAMVFVPVAAFAQNTKPPVEIEASKQLEWLRNENKYRATGDVMIKQGDTVIRGAYAEASYDAAKGPSSLSTMMVTGDVVITNQDRTIRAQKAVYNTVTETLVLNGGVVTLTTPTITVTAQNNMEYNATEHKAIARGDAEIIQQGKKLKADQVTAWFEADTNKIQRAEAVGHVFITSPAKNTKGPATSDIAQAHKAVYNADKNTIDLIGDVKLTQGQNHMQGDSAVVDLNTGYSSLKNAPGQHSKNRVRAIFSSNGDAPMPSITAQMPVVNSKKKYEPAYAVGVKPNEQQSTTNPQAIKPLGR